MYLLILVLLSSSVKREIPMEVLLLLMFLHLLLLKTARFIIIERHVDVFKPRSLSKCTKPRLKYQHATQRLLLLCNEDYFRRRVSVCQKIFKKLNRVYIATQVN